MEEDKLSTFLTSLVQQLYSLCSKTVKFKETIEIIGDIYITVDKSTDGSFSLMLNETLKRSTTNDNVSFESCSGYSFDENKLRHSCSVENKHEKFTRTVHTRNCKNASIQCSMRSTKAENNSHDKTSSLLFSHSSYKTKNFVDSLNGTYASESPSDDENKDSFLDKDHKVLGSEDICQGLKRTTGWRPTSDTLVGTTYAQEGVAATQLSCHCEELPAGLEVKEESDEHDLFMSGGSAAEKDLADSIQKTQSMTCLLDHEEKSSKKGRPSKHTRFNKEKTEKTLTRARPPQRNKIKLGEDNKLVAIVSKKSENLSRDNFVDVNNGEFQNSYHFHKKKKRARGRPFRIIKSGLNEEASTETTLDEHHENREEGIMEKSDKADDLIIHNHKPMLKSEVQKEQEILRLKLPMKVKDISQKLWTCKHCSKEFYSSAMLKEHKICHKGEKNWKCDLCPAAFSERYLLKRHGKSHTGEKPYICTLCGDSFTQKYSLVKHMRIHTGEKPYMCDLCGKSFACSSGLRTHRRTHTGEKPFICDHCGKRFSKSSNLRSHYRIHTGEKPYKCNECDMKFAFSTALMVHQRKHTGERPFHCDMCNKTFLQQSNLQDHQITHSGIKPFKCDVCLVSFAKKSYLKNHMTIHTGVKPFKCEICNASFAQKMGLKSHQRVHTGEKPYKCSTCGACFARSNGLLRHRKIHKERKTVVDDKADIFNMELNPVTFMERSETLNSHVDVPAQMLQTEQGVTFPGSHLANLSLNPFFSPSN